MANKKSSKNHTKSRFSLNIWYAIPAFIILLGVFLYLKMIYFPGRADLNQDDFQLIVTEGDIANARNIDIQTLSSFTGDYIVSTNAIDSLARLYQKTKDEKVALSLIQMYISHNQFDEAFTLISDVYHNDIDFTIIPASTFLYVLFNSSQLSPGKYELIANILTDYKQHVRIDDETYTLYSGLLAAYQDDMERFYDAIGALSGSKQYEYLVNAIGQAGQTASSLGSDVPYYKDALSSIALLDAGYFRVAQKVAVGVRQKDDKYILPYQVLAQAALLQSRRQEATQYFDTLLRLDVNHADQYHFGQCVSYFWQQSYSNALLHCQQITDPLLLPDAHRYMLLAHYQ